VDNPSEIELSWMRTSLAGTLALAGSDSGVVAVALGVSA
jgi:hypothetical protein